MTLTMQRAAAVLSLFLFVACKSSSTTPPPPPDASVSCVDATPCALTSGAPLSGDIATAAQVDVYSITAPASSGRTLIKIALTSIAPVTPVRFVYILENSDGSTVLASRGPQTGTGAQKLSGVYLLPAAGTYRIIVRDSLNTHADPLNGYSIEATVLPDPDTAEPDDTPPMARALTLSTTAATASGTIASTGDRDLAAFMLSQPTALVHWTVTAPAMTSPLQLRARLLLRSTASPNDLTAATSVAEYDAPSAGAALSVDVIRSLVAGSYLIAFDDKSGQQADPAIQWQTSIQQLGDPDPNEQTSRNDTAATATQLSPTGSIQGAIGSQGDVDWYEIDLPATSTAKVLALTLNPASVDQDIELTWAVGAAITNPTAACDQSCGPSAFCVSNKCAYVEHANHHFLHTETAPQSVRVRHLGPAAVVRVVVEDFGDLRWGNNLYTLSANLFDDPDPNEQTSTNDTLDSGTPLTVATHPGGGLSFASTGNISAWDAIDGLTTAETPADVDWYALPLPPRVLAPACPPAACYFPDGGVDLDGGADAGCPFDGGPGPTDAGAPLCTPNPLDGGPVYLPRPDYGLVLHWKNPGDGAYLLGLQGKVPFDGGAQTSCLFSLDQTFAHPDDGGSGGLVIGNAPNDPCFCVPGRNADELWLRTEAAHRSTAPTPALYSDQPYSFELDMNPGASGLTLACDGGCAGPNQPSACPGD